MKVGTVFEASHVPMRHLAASDVPVCSSKKGISSNQLHRTLGVTLKTAWFMSHRIREAMRVVGVEPMGGGGEIVEADETFIGRRKASPSAAGPATRTPSSPLFERGGSAPQLPCRRLRIADIGPIIRANVARETALMTDEAPLYRTSAGSSPATIPSITGGRIRARARVTPTPSRATIAVFKRGMKGVYQHCSERHLHRYLAEFDFRYSNRVRLASMTLSAPTAP